MSLARLFVRLACQPDEKWTQLKQKQKSYIDNNSMTTIPKRWNNFACLLAYEFGAAIAL